MTEMRAMGKEQSSSMSMTPAGLRREKHLSSQSESLSKLARPLNCRGCSLAVLSPGLLGLQAKLVVGPADDEYEREADRVAEQAVSMPEPSVQRACPSCEEDEPVQRKPLAARIMPLVQRQAAEEEEEELQTAPMVQRQEAGEEEEEKIQTAPEVSGSKGGPAGKDLEQSLEQARAGGRPLAEDYRGRMESVFGADFSSVRIHADEQADRLSRSIQARAFTRGQDIFLRQGEYQPASSEGQRLLAHELTHVVQQTQRRMKPLMQSKGQPVNDNPRMEEEADRMDAGALHWFDTNYVYQSRRYTAFQEKAINHPRAKQVASIIRSCDPCVFQRMQDLTDAEWNAQGTHLAAELEGPGPVTHDLGKFHSDVGGHAEDNLIAALPAAVAGLPPGHYNLVIMINRSPCSNIGTNTKAGGAIGVPAGIPGCMEKLIALQLNGIGGPPATHTFSVIIHYKHLYGKNSNERALSGFAVEMGKNAGIQFAEGTGHFDVGAAKAQQRMLQ